MGTRNNPGEYNYYELAQADEPMFVLLARDARSPGMVRDWAKAYVDSKRKENEIPGTLTAPQLDRYLEAMDVANAMDAWRRKSLRLMLRQQVLESFAEVRRSTLDP